jgi:transcriptional regulator GlxA family with amidase domain
MLRLIIEGGELSADSILSRMPAAASSLQVRSAVELMHEKLHEPLTLGSLAAQLGISGRSLQQGFRRYQDTTPLAYLRQLRLEAVHRELSNPQNTLGVGEVAAKWGFAHVGRLAKLYRDSYGQSPSETVQRALRRR